MTERIEYDEFAYFADNASEYGIPYDGPPAVRREEVELDDGRRVSALVWGTSDPELVLVHGGAQNAHTWDTVALALDRPLVAVDLPGHGHSDAAAPADGRSRPELLAPDLAEAVRRLAPDARGVVGMSLGGLTSIALTAVAPELVRSLVLVDVTPGVTGEKAKAILDFVRGPATFASFDDLLARTIEHNPTRTESSLRRGILHNAVQQEDGSWIWRYRLHDGPAPMDEAPDVRDRQRPAVGRARRGRRAGDAGARDAPAVGGGRRRRGGAAPPAARCAGGARRRGRPQRAGRHARRARRPDRRLRAALKPTTFLAHG